MGRACLLLKRSLLVIKYGLDPVCGRALAAGADATQVTITLRVIIIIVSFIQAITSAPSAPRPNWSRISYAACVDIYIYILVYNAACMGD
jgi:hypothetical protein